MSNERELIQQLRDALRLARNFVVYGGSNMSEIGVMRKATDAADVYLTAPVAHASCLSWNGFNLHGDDASITEARRLLDRSDRCAALEAEIKAGQLVRPSPVAPATPVAPALVPLTDRMVFLGARCLSDKSADECGIDREDMWKTYGDDYLRDVRDVLTAAHGIKP